ncbi:recombinase family protein [uncultured Helicobacter sp.]|uniref:recombinase family protein n=1 Tax=uncultured Helicobacter sp. TaxID=175537 RepID=UPI00374FA59C
MIYAYIRVSSEKQHTEHQIHEVKTFAEQKGLNIDLVVQEKISGKVAIDHRELGKLRKKLKKNDMIIVPELSRLGRSLLNVMSFLNFCAEKGIRIYSIKEKFELGDNIQSKVIAFAFSLSAEIERQLISQRTREALAYKKSLGVHIGRPFGRRSSSLNAKCVKYHDRIVKWLNDGVSPTKMAEMLKIARGTMYRYLAYTELKIPKHRKHHSKWERGIY